MDNNMNNDNPNYDDRPVRPEPPKRPKNPRIKSNINDNNDSANVQPTNQTQTYEAPAKRDPSAPPSAPDNKTKRTSGGKKNNRGKKKNNTVAVVIAVVLVLCVAVTVIIAASGRNSKINKKIDEYMESSSAALTETTEPPAPEKIQRTVSFAAVGDNIIYQAGFTDAKNRAVDGGRDYNFAPLYTDIKPVIENADLAYINQETQMAGEDYGYSDYPQFNSPRDLAYDLIETGFDIVTTANNHMLDMGTDGLESTINFWNSLDGVTLVGGYLSEEDFMNIRVIEKNDIKIAVIAFTYSTNGYTVKEGSDIYIPYIDDDDIKRQMEAANKVSDVQLVSIHWGIENDFEPSDDQKHTAQLLADLGADAIIGAHPHVIQPVEWLTGKNGNKTLCIYSLGDLVAVMMRGSNMLGGLMTFDIVRDGNEFSIENPLFTPLVCHFGPSYYNCHIYYLKDFNDDLADTFANVYGVTADKDDLADIVKDTVSPEFLPEEFK
ncbi:MAG: CapA family protein [Clostridia bacterium]|nr:CapA family protein [Clostridia bacterium]